MGGLGGKGSKRVLAEVGSVAQRVRLEATRVASRQDSLVNDPAVARRSGSTGLYRGRVCGTRFAVETSSEADTSSQAPPRLHP